MAKSAVEILEMIKNPSVPDKEIRKEIDSIPAKAIDKEVKETLLRAVHDIRPDFYKEWQLDVASKYM